MGEGATTQKGETSTPSRSHNPARYDIPSICRIGEGYNLVTKEKQNISVDKPDKVCYHVYNGKGQPEPPPCTFTTEYHPHGTADRSQPGKAGADTQGHDPHRQRDKGNTGRGGRNWNGERIPVDWIGEPQTRRLHHAEQYRQSRKFLLDKCRKM